MFLDMSCAVQVFCLSVWLTRDMQGQEQNWLTSILNMGSSNCTLNSPGAIAIAGAPSSGEYSDSHLGL